MVLIAECILCVALYTNQLLRSDMVVPHTPVDMDVSPKRRGDFTVVCEVSDRLLHVLVHKVSNDVMCLRVNLHDHYITCLKSNFNNISISQYWNISFP